MNQVAKRSRRFPDVPSFLSGFFDDEPFFRNNWWQGADTPAANVKENDDAFLVELAVPGLEKEDFQIDLDYGTLTVSAEKKSEQEDANEGYTRQEFSYSSFKRTFQLPDVVDEQAIVAKYNNGVLMLTLPKRAKTPDEETRKAIPIS